MNKKISLSLIGFAALIVSIGFYFTPYIAVHNMRKAAENRDAETLSDYVDYPSLRESIKANLNAKFAGEAVKSPPKSPFEAFGAALAVVLVNRMVDAFVTPESLAMLMKGEKPGANSSAEHSGNDVKSDRPKTETSMAYEGINRFVVKVQDKEKNQAGAPVELVFKRYGLVSWKLASLRLP